MQGRIGRGPRLGLAAMLFGLTTVAGCQAPRAAHVPGAVNSCQFCFWNVENLFDDQDDGRNQAGDKEFDTWFARDQQARALKYHRLCEALVNMNNHKGPDILAVAEVESFRAAEKLRTSLNNHLTNPDWFYDNVLMKELTAGRHIAPAIITRLPVRADKTRLHGKHQRILEGHVVVNGHDLVIIASHWTSRLTDKDGAARSRYGDVIYGLYRAMAKSNPAVDFLVCGDFNDPPEAPSVAKHLHAVGDRDEALRSQQEEKLLLLDLFANKDPNQFGTHYFSGKWFIFDQIVASPGLLDQKGWSCDPDSARTDNSLVRPNDKQRRPWRFGNEHDKFERGYSDHFPVTVQLRVEGAASEAAQ
jgi:endonuclease/exonuclease/phosphatase family metal-dependent hydrolase